MSLTSLPKNIPALCLTAIFSFCSHLYADDVVYFSLEDFSKADGKTIYTQICQGCHMPEGKGANQVGFYPAFSNNPTVQSPHYIALTVMNGRKNMPGFSQATAGNAYSTALTDAQIADLTNYIRSSFGNSFTDKITEAEVTALRQSAVKQ